MSNNTQLARTFEAGRKDENPEVTAPEASALGEQMCGECDVVVSRWHFFCRIITRGRANFLRHNLFHRVMLTQLLALVLCPLAA